MRTLRCKCGKKTGLFYMSTKDCHGCGEIDDKTYNESKIVD